MKTARPLYQHVRNRFVTGLIVLLPLTITFLILRIAYNLASDLLTSALSAALPGIPEWALFMFAICVLVAVIYGVGVFANMFVGHRIVGFGENLLLRVPLLRAVYGASKQLVNILFASGGAGFKAVVLVEFPRPGMRALGFITGTTKDERGELCYKVFIPTTPNPTSGFLEIIKQSEVVPSKISVEDGIKMIVSGGILGPAALDGSAQSAETTGEPNAPNNAA